MLHLDREEQDQRVPGKIYAFLCYAYKNAGEMTLESFNVAISYLVVIVVRE